MPETSDADDKDSQPEADENGEAANGSFAPQENTWKLATVALASVLLIVSLTLIISPGAITGASCQGEVKDSISADEAANLTLNYLSTQIPQGEATVGAKKEASGVYSVNLTYQGNNIHLFVSKDGKYLFQGIKLSKYNQNAENNQQDQGGQSEDKQEQETSNNVPKRDKAKVELFIMSYCPYGTQMEKAVLPVAELLGDKIDFENKFVYYAMHGEKEIKEQTRQYCIQKKQPDKYLGYLRCFLKDGDTEGCLQSNNIDQETMDGCVEQAKDKFNITENLENKSSWLSGKYPLYKVHWEENQKYGVKGSPTLVVNGKKVSAQRTPSSVLDAVCSGFKNQPEECNTNLSSSSPSTNFGFSESGSSNSASCG